MVFPFGVSIGDFIVGIKLFEDAIESLSDTRGGRADFVELRNTLDSLDIALDATSQFGSVLHLATVDVVGQRLQEMHLTISSRCRQI
jgi:hypothetical protein